MIQLICQMHLLFCLTNSQEQLCPTFFSGVTVRSLFQYFLQVVWGDGPDLHHCYLNLLRKKCLCYLKAGNFIAILRASQKQISNI